MTFEESFFLAKMRKDPDIFQVYLCINFVSDETTQPWDIFAKQIEMSILQIINTAVLFISLQIYVGG